MPLWLVQLIELFKWPALVFSLFFTFCLFFKLPLKALIGRIRGVSATGVNFGSEGEKNQGNVPIVSPVGSVEPSKNTTSEGRLLTYHDAIRQIDNPALSAEIVEVEAFLNRNKMEPEVERNMLIRHLSIFNLEIKFLTINRMSYRSQEILLRNLNVSPRSEQYVRDAFAAAVAASPAYYAAKSFDEWVSWMLSQNLILKIENNRYNITVFGRDYLKWEMEKGFDGVFKSE